jgi:hypothetical protein
MAPHIFWWLEPQPEQVFFGLLMGALASVGLYQVVRAIAERRMRAIAERSDSDPGGCHPALFRGRKVAA